MPGGLNGRVRRLENGRVGPCEECGFDGDFSNVEIVVEWDDIDALEASAKKDPPEPKFCGTCGHQLEYVVTWGDLPPEQGGTKEEGRYGDGPTDEA
jgi:hypothetical protein